jgi:hypothetical protein
MVGTMTPIDPKMLSEERGDDHAGSIVDIPLGS